MTWWAISARPCHVVVDHVRQAVRQVPPRQVHDPLPEVLVQDVWVVERHVLDEHVVP
jgi:hypothetical protein